MVSLLTYWIASWPPEPEHRRGEAGFHVGGEFLLPLRAHDRLDRALFTVLTPTIVSTRNCWLAAPRLNFSPTSSRKGGRTENPIRR